MNIVLIGANGYVGRAIMRAVAACPEDYQVRAQARNLGGLQQADNITLLQGSLEHIHPDLFPETPHVLIHVAGKNIDHDGSGYQQINVAGSRNLLAHCNSSTQGILYHSSLSVLGQNRQQRVSNTEPTAPTTDLARSRADAENLVLKYATKHNRTAYCLRPRFILGKDDAFVIPALQKLVAKGLYIGDGQQQFSIIDVDDYAQLILDLCNRITRQDPLHQQEQMALNVGYALPLPFASMYDTLQSITSDTRIKRRIHYPAALATAFNLLPIKKLQSLATQLQLIGLDHYSDVSETRKRLLNDVLDRDSFVYFRELAQQFKDSPCN